MSYTLENNSGKIKVSSKFIKSCMVFENLFNDTCDDNTNESIPISDNFDLEKIKKMVEFYDVYESFRITTEDGNEISYLDYIIDYREEYIQKYTALNKDPPLCKEIVDLFNKYENELIEEFITMDSYFNNKKLIHGIMFCIVAFVRVGDEEEVDKIMEAIMDKLNEE